MVCPRGFHLVLKRFFAFSGLRALYNQIVPHKSTIFGPPLMIKKTKTKGKALHVAMYLCPS